MKSTRLKIVNTFLGLFMVLSAFSQNGLYNREFKTYCNPIDIDYTYMGHNAHRGVSYRSGADPAVLNFKGKYYMFVTRSHGYWSSDDMSNWKFIRPQSWYFNGSNAPGVAVKDEEIIAIANPSGRNAVIRTDNPDLGDWKTTYGVIPIAIQDPGLFVDDDGRVYLYEESSNVHPIRGVELEADNYYLPKTGQIDLFNLDPDQHGWERFGQNHDSELKPFIEGPWMTKHKGKYYLEYSAPGTQWNVYADGVYIGDNPLGPFEYAAYNPISYKPGGFLTGAGHGSTVKDNHNSYWHFASMPISVNYKFERRLGLFPAGFENNGQMYVNTAYGDYPHYLPDTAVKNHKERFTGWMLLSYNKKTSTNSTVKEGIVQEIVDESEKGYMLDQEEATYDISKVVDENIRSFWVANGNDDTIHITIDLEKPMKVYALQINFQDFNATVFGRVPGGLQYRFIIEASKNGKDWNTLVDYSQNDRDQPHAYIELDTPIDTRFVRYRNIDTPNEYLSIAEFRVFGKGYGKVPRMPKEFKVVRQSDSRNADLSWKADKNAMGYMLFWGIEEDKLNNSVMVYGDNQYALRALNTGQKYYYQVEAFNENGISEKSKILND